MQFTIPGDDETYELVSSRFTFGEAKALEKVTGVTMSEIADGGPAAQSAAVMQGMFWISMKRKRPTLAYVELEDLPIDDIEFLAEDDDEQESLDDGDPLGPTNPAPEDGAGAETD